MEKGGKNFYVCFYKDQDGDYVGHALGAKKWTAFRRNFQSRST